MFRLRKRETSWNRPVFELADERPAGAFDFDSSLPTHFAAKKTEGSHEPPVFWWSEWGDLNSRPLGPEPSALPAALHPETAFIL